MTISIENAVAGMVTTGLLVAGVVWWIVSRGNEQRRDTEAKLNSLRGEIKDVSSTLHTRIDKKAEQSSFEHDKLWAQVDMLRNNTAGRAEVENLGRKMEKHMDKLGQKMDTVVELYSHIADLNARVKAIEDVMKVD